MASKTQEDVTSLEGARTRLARLDHALESLRRDLQTSDSLPPWPMLQTSLARIVDQLRNASLYMVSDADLLSSALAYPLPSFPGIEMFGVAEALFRSDNGQDLNEFAEESRKLGLKTSSSEGNNRMNRAEFQELWNFADAYNDGAVENLELGGIGEESDNTGGVRDNGNSMSGQTSSAQADGQQLPAAMKPKISNKEQNATSHENAFEGGHQTVALEKVMRFVSSGALPSSLRS